MMNLDVYIPLPVVLVIFITIIIWLFVVTFCFWILYLPNVAVRDRYSFVYMFNNSKGARLTIFLQIFYYIIFIIPYFLIYYFHSEHLANILMAPVMVLFAIVMLSNTYLEWQLLEKNRK